MLTGGVEVQWIVLVVVGSPEPVNERADRSAGRHHHVSKLGSGLERWVIAGDRDDRDGSHRQQRGNGSNPRTHLLQLTRHAS